MFKNNKSNKYKKNLFKNNNNKLIKKNKELLMLI